MFIRGYILFFFRELTLINGNMEKSKDIFYNETDDLFSLSSYFFFRVFRSELLIDEFCILSYGQITN